MKKRISILLVVVMAALLMFGLTGCGNTEPTQEQKDKIIGDAVKGYFTSLPTDNYLITADKFKSEVLDKKDPSAQIVDLRAKADYDKGHVEGAINDPFGKDFDISKIDKSKNVYVYCYSGQTGSQTLVALKIAGYTNVKSVNGGAGKDGAENTPIKFNTAKIPMVK